MKKASRPPKQTVTATAPPLPVTLPTICTPSVGFKMGDQWRKSLVFALEQLADDLKISDAIVAVILAEKIEDRFERVGCSAEKWRRCPDIDALEAAVEELQKFSDTCKARAAAMEAGVMAWSSNEGIKILLAKSEGVPVKESGDTITWPNQEDGARRLCEL